MRTFSILLALCLVAASCSPVWAQRNPADDRIYDDVRRKLAGDAVVKGGGLEVEVQDGVVTLKGKVREEKQKKRAEHLTRKVKGVKQVNNHLVIEPY